MRIHFAYGDGPWEFNTTVFRVQIPAAELLAHGHDTTISRFNFLNELQPPIDAVIIERNFFNAVIFEQVRRLKSLGVKIIATFDDAYDLMPDTCPSKSTWNEANLHLFKRALKMCDLAITPSKLLCQDYERFCKMQYVPNFFDADLYIGLKKKSTHGLTNILWGGNDTHLESVKQSGVLEALTKLCKRNKRVVVHCVGGQSILRLFQDVLPPAQYQGYNWMPLERWPAFVAEHADIGIAPLCGEYDRRRSWIKAVDFGMLGIPIVATNYEPYRELPITLVENNPDEWYNALQDLIRDKSWRDTEGQSLCQVIENLSIQKNWRVYEDICKKE